MAFGGSSAGGTGLTFCTYLSPEQAAGMAVDARSDMFSLGGALYEMATGKPAFGSSNANQTARSLLQDSPAPPRNLNPDIPAALEAIILKAIAREREQRYQSAALMLQDLLAIIDVPRLIALKEFTTAEHLLIDQQATDPQNPRIEQSLREVEEQIKLVRKSDYISQLRWQAEEAASSLRYAEAIEIYTRAVNVDPSAEFLRSKKNQSPNDEERARTIRDIKARIDQIRSIAHIKKLPDWIDPESRDQQAVKHLTLNQNETLHRYRILRLLHSGPETDLYEAKHEATGHRVAVEVLQVIAGTVPVVTIRSDINLILRLAHPNLCAVHEVGDYKGAPYVVQDYLEGGYSLESVVDLGEMSPARKLEVLRQVCNGLDFAHRNGLTGLDIIPSMVMLQRDGQVKLIDYWIDRPQIALDPTSGSQRPSIRDKYRPPEEWKGARSLAQVNTWAVGVMLYRLFLYRHPFSGSDVNEVAANTQNQSLRPLADQLTTCPRGLDVVLAKALAKDPQQRYQSAEAMASDLQSVITRLERDARQPAVSAPPSAGARLINPESGDRQSLKRLTLNRLVRSVHSSEPLARGAATRPQE